jgi:transposase
MADLRGMKKKNNKVVFKPYNQYQLNLLPPSLEELIDSKHPVRVVNQIIDKIDIDSLLKKYQGGGASNYHPKMLLKVLVYGYVCNVYSSRKLEAAAKENIHFMWLVGMEKPDHNTINRFRSDRLKGVLKEVFGKVVHLLVESGHVSLQQAYVDGTKIEANANRYTFVWGRSIKYHKEKIVTQLKELWDYAQQMASEELKDTSPTSFEEIDATKVQQTIQQIDEALKEKPVNKKIKQKINYARKNWPGSLEKYEQQENILGKRNSFSKTDPDATFMRMKEDHMLNGQLKPAYNLQIATNDQFILSYSIHQNPTDTLTLKPQLEEFKELHGSLPKEIVADAGYGSQENYAYLEKEKVESYIKYNQFDREQNSKFKKDPFKTQNLLYNTTTDSYSCPSGECMVKVGEGTRISANGYKQKVSYYEAKNCKGCPLRIACHDAKGNRRIEVNHRLNKYRKQAHKMLNSERGLYHRSKRPVDVEPVFGNIKNNKGFKRFMLKGIKKVEIEAGLLAMAHNLKKVAA